MITIFIVILSIKNIKVSEKLKQEFKRTISWKNYTPEIKTQPKKQQFRLYD